MRTEWLRFRSWKFWFLVFIIANILDLHSTALLISKAGIEVEFNPIMFFLYQRWGLLGMGLSKVLLIFAVFWALRANESLHPIVVKVVLGLSVAVIAILTFCSYFVYFVYSVYFA